ncbi:hypothetical protein [Fuerstiella marisgermanici]|uniref:DUF885 domain-containing protein n=1 Tax=Fuerstiella marisgermanici TaxID=1891926 RepID=A0A1P8WE03_9PLAN|nr:hypothetical protein [Fuerstiella marisgermanici]APZ92315.1 hypothetical protein Fuma_01925 [Fuerstiella marisgermanici]
MNLFRATLTALTLISVLLMNESAVAQKKETVVEKFADALGDLLREAVGEKKVVPAQRIRQMAQPALPEPAPDQLKRREERLTAYSNAMVEWIAPVCELSPEETALLQKFAADRVAEKQKDWKPDPNRDPLHDTFPVKFTLAMGTAEQLDLTRQQRKLNGLLNDEQLDRLSAAADERRAFHLHATVERVLNMLDEELYLTAAQRKEMYQPLRERLDGMEGSSFAFTPQSYYYKQQSLAFLLRRGDHLKCLNAAQRARAKDFSDAAASQNNNGVSNEQYLYFSSSEGMHTWGDKLLEASKIQRERISRACAVRAAYGQAEWGLSDEDARHLEIAGKGVAENLIEDWKKTTRQRLKTYEDQAGRFGGNFSFGVSVPDLNLIESDALWKHTVESLLPVAYEPALTRHVAMRRSSAIHLTALLDKELWLRPEQRSKVQELVEESLPSGNFQNPYRKYMEEVATLVMPLFKFSKQDATVFQGAQQEAWNAMKGEFDFNGRYVQVNLANGGSFNFQIPK